MPERLLGRVATPALPVAGMGPDKTHHDNLNNVLRLYFNSASNAINNVTGHLGGRFLDQSNGLFFSVADQTAATVNTGYPIQFENTYLNHGVAINGGSGTQITVEYSGIYNFQFTGSVYSNSASSKSIYLWIKRSGTDVGYSTKQYIVAGSGDITPISWSFNIDMTTGQYIEMMWATSDTTAILDAVAATTPHPGIPSAVVAVTLVSALPDTLPTPT
jgi:hypothetical protein